MSVVPSARQRRAARQIAALVENGQTPTVRLIWQGPAVVSSIVRKYGEVYLCVGGSIVGAQHIDTDTSEAM